MTKRKENAIIWSIGSLGYGLLEILWRGYTHWSMLLTGGFCFTSIYRLNTELKTKNILKKCALFSLVITCYEFVAGCLFNKLLRLNVWDYSSRKLNILGQICPFFSCLWFLLSFPLVFLCKILKSNFIK